MKEYVVELARESFQQSMPCMSSPSTIIVVARVQGCLQGCAAGNFIRVTCACVCQVSMLAGVVNGIRGKQS